MDLKLYGIHYTLDKELPTFSAAHLHAVAFKKGLFEFQDDSYKARRLLGKGTYGTTYEVESARTGARYAMKVQRYSSETEIDNIVRESIMNIIMEHVSSTEQKGPYVGRFYEIGIIESAKLVLMRTQMLDGTLGDYIIRRTKQENDKIVPNFFIQLANILEFFQSTLEFSHRDLKSDNIMYELVDNKPQLRLIDFGLTCMTWNGIHISTNTFFPEDHICLRPNRDLSQFIMEFLLDYEQYISKKLYDLLAGLATFHVHGSKCRLDRYCPLHGLKEWVNSYEFLNRINVDNPKANPAKVRSSMKQFRPVTQKRNTRKQRKN